MYGVPHGGVCGEQQHVSPKERGPRVSFAVVLASVSFLMILRAQISQTLLRAEFCNTDEVKTDEFFTLKEPSEIMESISH